MSFNHPHIIIATAIIGNIHGNTHKESHLSRGARDARFDGYDNTRVSCKSFCRSGKQYSQKSAIL